MTLENKLIHNDQKQDKIPIEGIMAVIGEVRRGKLTKAEADTILGIDAGEKTQLSTLIASAMDMQEIKDVLNLSELGYAYSDESGLKTRLSI